MFIRVFVLTVLFSRVLFGSSAVTYAFSGGRFGDNLISYLHAKSFAEQNNLPLLYQPFPYSSQLLMSSHEHHYTECIQHFRKGVSLANGLPSVIEDETIYVCPYFPAIMGDSNNRSTFPFSVDWKDPKFRRNALKLIGPKNAVHLTYPPKEMISVALHVREGGGFDPDDVISFFKLKIPHISFYIESLKVILQLFPGKTIYCHLFTDAKDPRSCLNKILLAMPENVPIQFQYREVGNQHDSSVLEDFFSLFNFDILIRPDSNFSIVPSLLYDYAVVCYPIAVPEPNQPFTRDHIKVEINTDNFDKVSSKGSL